MRQQTEQGKMHKLNVAMKKSSPHSSPSCSRYTVNTAGSRSLIKPHWFHNPPPPTTFKSNTIIHACEECHQNPEGGGGGEREGESELKKTAKLKGLRRGVRHAGDKFLEPLQGIWGYACQSDRAAREEREENTSSERERGEKKKDGI